MRIKITIAFLWEADKNEIDDDYLRKLIQSVGVKNDESKRLIEADIVSIGLYEKMH